MDVDSRLLELLDPQGDPILHFYEWDSPSATFGYFADPACFIDLNQAALSGVKLGRRPTGGGITFHIWDCAFSFLMPGKHPAFSLNALENYRFVNETVINVVAEIFHMPRPGLADSKFAGLDPACQNFCMAKPTRYDVVYQEKKIAGAAQRRKKQGYLHQGTISLAAPDMGLLQALLPNQSVLDAMAQFTFSPLGSFPSRDLLHETKGEIRRQLVQKFMEKV